MKAALATLVLLKGVLYRIRLAMSRTLNFTELGGVALIITSSSPRKIHVHCNNWNSETT